MPAKKPQDNQASSDFSTGSSAYSDSGSGSGKSADEIRETVKEAVGKGVAAVAGVADGINETMEETRLDETAEKAIRQVGETTSKVVSAARESVDEVRSAVKGESGRSADEGIGLSGSYQEESSQSDLTATSPSIGSSSFSSDSSGVSEPYALASQEEE
jgi:hypothetical protein